MLGLIQAWLCCAKSLSGSIVVKAVKKTVKLLLSTIERALKGSRYAKRVSQKIHAGRRKAKSA